MSEEKDLEIRLTGHAYELTGPGGWTYYLRLRGAGKDNTFHPDVAWPTKQEAVAALKEHAKTGMTGAPITSWENHGSETVDKP